ncbi:hypothetical protein [Oceaniglobus indicus]|uniref:DUF7742 family protein n=1 Tax=Oceaniglobus indicus TaxID=2047749 RepID=UPI000C19F56C|nr:hypothetical protein [Oceaniglobus indicus]
MFPFETPWLGDAAAIARVLCAVGPARRAWVLERMLREAGRAAHHRRRHRRAHPLWGDGSLMAAALRRRPGPEPSLADPVFSAALGLVLARLHAGPAP